MNCQYICIFIAISKFKCKQGVITAIQSTYGEMMSQRYSLSFGDFKLLNYYCNDTCSDKITDCQTPKECTKCKCPIGFEGDRYAYVEVSSKECGILALEAKPGIETLEDQTKNKAGYFVYSNIITFIKCIKY
uniref:Peptidase M12A domain-containing protein n=1 Tax=Rhabditophanes sp. KR3021 TaxID=114890 RepID=A0AC35TX34_9BILA